MVSQHFDPRGYKVSPNYADSVNWGQCLYWYRNHLNMDKLKKSRINPTEKELFLQTNPERSIFSHRCITTSSFLTILTSRLIAFRIPLIAQVQKGQNAKKKSCNMFSWLFSQGRGQSKAHTHMTFHLSPPSLTPHGVKNKRATI